MKSTKITKNVHWVGAIDWGLRDFHGYSTSRGSSYNAFLIMADKITLIDTVKAPFKDEMMRRIASVIDPKKIDYIISNHAEMDHSGSLPEVVAEIKPEKVFASKKGVEALNAHFNLDFKVEAVDDGGELDLGNMKLKFLETRMLHWPDSMMTYLEKEKILFAQDGFGMHLASNERFDDELDWNILEFEAAKYYANILTPYSNFVLKLADKLAGLNLDIKYLAPDHGPVWRKNIGKIIELYGKWASQKPTNKAVVVFDTMWQSTAKMGLAIADGIGATNCDVKVMPMHGSNRSDVATELLDAGALVVGSPTMNNQMFPTIADILCYIKGLRFQNLVGQAFGSYGWGGEAVTQVKKSLEEMKIEFVGEEMKVKYVPKEDDIKKCYALGEQIGKKISA